MNPVFQPQDFRQSDWLPCCASQWHSSVFMGGKKSWGGGIWSDFLTGFQSGWVPGHNGLVLPIALEKKASFIDFGKLSASDKAEILSCGTLRSINKEKLIFNRWDGCQIMWPLGPTSCAVKQIADISEREGAEGRPVPNQNREELLYLQWLQGGFSCIMNGAKEKTQHTKQMGNVLYCTRCNCWYKHRVPLEFPGYTCLIQKVWRDDKVRVHTRERGV